MTNEYDVAIIGAGPGGSACALALHKSGLRVVLVDKEVFPRDKVCGDAIPSGAFKAMDRISPTWGKAMRQFADKMDIRTSTVFSTNGKTMTLDWELAAYNSKRLHFDNFLLQLVRSETATTILENKRLKQATPGADSVHCQFEDGSSLHAAMVIGCDGANSVVKRQLNNSAAKKNHSCAAVRAYVQGVEGVKAGVNEFHFFKELLPGYFWIFPLQNGWTNVGFGILQNKEERNARPVHLRNTLNSIITTQPGISPRFKNAERMNIKGFPLPLGTQRTAVSGERFMLCGDAASLVDPLQGHGIDKAMWSSLLAAEQAITCFKKADFSADFMGQYDTALYKKIGPELTRNTHIMRSLMRFPGLIVFVTWLGQHRKLTLWMARLFKI